ncbi:hypothetical protein JW707_04285 [Candidatus Woesearchaeota archaeon]|nr:hypothetical protein [Candidatus Woesearchaeota archaeon]
MKPYYHNGRGSTREVREVYVTLGDRNLERTARDLDIFVDETPLLGKSRNTIERYRQVLDSVWVPEKVRLADYYTLGDFVKVYSACVLGEKRRNDVVECADERAKQRAKKQHKEKITGALTELVDFYGGIIENCDGKVAEVREERDVSYEKASVSESLALKEMDYTRALKEREGKAKEDMKKIMGSGEESRINDCERIINDIRINIENCRMRARFYAKQNEVYLKKGEECAERIDYIEFLRGKYLQIITQAKIMLAQINANEFNISNCLLTPVQIHEHNSLMENAEGIVVKQEDAQESSLELAFGNFGFQDEYSGNKSFRDAVERAKEESEHVTNEELKAMNDRRKRRLDSLLSS